MKLAYAIFAKCAEESADATYSLLGGGFSGITVPSFPAQVPQIALVVRLDLEPDEISKPHKLGLGIRGLGDEAIPCDLVIGIRPEQFAASGTFPTFNGIFTVVGLPLAGVGKYEFRIIVDDSFLGSAFLHVSAGTIALPVPSAETKQVRVSANGSAMGSTIIFAEREEALKIREEWMRLNGFSEEEIEYNCKTDTGPVSLAEEKNNLRAIKRLEQIAPSREELSAWAIKY